MRNGDRRKLLRPRQRLGKYIIERRLAEGGFAVVYRARDTIEGRRVALKIPHYHLMDEDAIDDFRREIRLAAKLDHPNVLPLKNAEMINGQLIIVSELGEMTLDERLQKRLKVETAQEFSRQMLEAVAYAHDMRIIHCDIKPDNFLIFKSTQLRLTDFGIARIAQRTVRGSGTGTVGYIAPEQALGKPSFRSDVFSLGLILYRMFSGCLPDWPYDWPPPRHASLRGRVSSEFEKLIRKAIHVNARLRFSNAGQMLKAFERIRNPVRASGRSRSKSKLTKPASKRDWKSVRRREFKKQYGKILDTRLCCSSCKGPISEAMTSCPWCGKSKKKLKDESKFPAYCSRCHRGMKLDWSNCPWCYGHSYEPLGDREYTDRRYTAKCSNASCKRKSLMPFMRYCPWCKRRVKKKWKIKGSRATCSRCKWGILAAFWSHCPWCSKKIPDQGG